MSKWKFDFNSAAIGTIGMFTIIMLVEYNTPHVGIPYENFEQEAKIETRIDSSKTVDWTQPKIDTLVVLPINSSTRFKNDVTHMIKNKRVKSLNW